MKRFLSLLFVMVLLLTPCAYAEDAVSSATLDINRLPELEDAEDARILVLWFSPNDTIKAAAYVIADELDADILEVSPEIPYNANDLNYNDSTTRATVEQRDPAARPEIAELPDIEDFDIIFLGYPIWWGQAPQIMYTLFESVDFSGKTIQPFSTSGSSSVVNAAENLAKLTDETVTWMPAKRLDNGSSEEDILEWITTLALEES